MQEIYAKYFQEYQVHQPSIDSTYIRGLSSAVLYNYYSTNCTPVTGYISRCRPLKAGASNRLCCS